MEDEGFLRLINYLEPLHAMPSRHYFSDEALPELYSVVYVHKEKLLADATCVSFMTDTWALWRTKDFADWLTA